MPSRTNIEFASKTLAQMAETKARKNGLNLSEYLQQLVADDIGQSLGSPRKKSANRTRRLAPSIFQKHE